MPCQLLDDCLYLIFELLEQDHVTLHSCLLVNHHWCEISVRILWRNVWPVAFHRRKSSLTPDAYNDQLKVQSSILSTLVSCLPDESKNLLIIPTPTSKPPLFNYATFCRVLSIHEIDQMVYDVLYSLKFDNFNLKDTMYLVVQELLKMFMRQIPSLKRLDYHFNSCYNLRIPFTNFPGARNCLKNLSKLSCSSKHIYFEFFKQLSKICRNIQSITVIFEKLEVLDGLIDLISAQQNLKYLHMILNDSINWTKVIPSLKKHSNSLIELRINGRKKYEKLSFITMFTNLQELVLSFPHRDSFVELNELQYDTFSQLQVVKFPDKCPIFKVLVKFLESNGKNVKELHVSKIGKSSDTLNSAIAKVCPNLNPEFSAVVND